MRQCNYAGDDCYFVRVHPKIDQISKSYGSLAGGQTLEIRGFGFNSEDVKVSVDGVDCALISTSETLLKCKTGAK